MPTPRRTVISLISAVIALLGNFHVSQAGEIRTTVKYVTETHVYIAAGQNAGVEKGDYGEILAGVEIAARIEIEFVAAGSASGKIISGSYRELTPGQEIIVHTPVGSGEAETDKPVEAIPARPDSSLPEVISVQGKTTGTKPRLLGRVGIQYYFQDDLDEFNYDYHQPSVYLNLTLADIISPGFSLRMRMRSRQGSGQFKPADIAGGSWNSRLYELSFNYYEPEARISYSAGRVLSRELSGMGYLDGAVLKYKTGENSSFGVMGGTRPDPATSRFNSETTKTGVFYRYEKGGYSNNRLSGTAAAAGQYVNGQIDREFIYQQIDYSRGRKFYLYQSSEINISRGWRRSANGGSVQAANLLVQARYNFSNSFGVSAGYDNRRNVYTYYNRSTPDSLFDDSMRQGYRLGLNLKPARGFNISLNLVLRTVSGGDNAQFYSSAASYSNLLNSGISAGYRAAVYDNNYSRGMQNALSFSTNIWGRNNVVVSAGNNRYEYSSTGQQTEYNWARIDNYYYFSRKVYFSGSYEIQHGENQNSNRVYLDFGVRL